MWCGYLADAVVVAHVGYVAYVVAGQFAIWLGWIFHRQWARNLWFRVTHLIAIVVVALEAAMGWTCPLTNWENQLRVLAGQEVEAGSFLGRLFHRLIFYQCPEGLLDAMHIGFAILVLATFLLFPPRRPKWLSRRPSAP